MVRANDRAPSKHKKLTNSILFLALLCSTAYSFLSHVTKEEGNWDPGCYVELIFSLRLRNVKSREKVTRASRPFGRNACLINAWVGGLGGGNGKERESACKREKERGWGGGEGGREGASEQAERSS